MRWPRARDFACALAIGLALAFANGAAAGTFPHCEPEPTLETEVARAPLVVIAQATRRTRHRGHERRTEFAVTRVVRGALATNSITVDDCDDWKCTGLDVARGAVVVLLLRAGEHRGHWAPIDRHCRNGFQSSWLRYDEHDPDVAAVIAAAAASP